MSNTGTNSNTTRGRGYARGRGLPRNARIATSLVTAGHQEFVQGNSPGTPGGSFTIVIGGPQVLQLTVHRPIGYTDLTAEEWVLTPTEEVSQLLERKEDPTAPIILSRREQHRMNAAIAAGLAIRDTDGGYIRYPGHAESRRDLLDAATAAAKEALPTGRSPSKAQVIAKLPEEFRDLEVALLEFLQSDAVRNAAATAFPIAPFRTMSGPVADRPQRAIPGLTGMSAARARDELVRRLYGQQQQQAMPTTAAPADGGAQ